MTPASSVLVAAGGIATLGLSALAVRDGDVSSVERRVFHAINDLPDWLYKPLFVFQQFGNIVVALVVVLALAALLRSWPVAAAGVLAVVAKLGLERVVKAAVERERPATSTGGAILRGDVSAAGLSFVSGHAAITVALAVVLTHALPGRWRVVPWVVVVLNGIARIYVGAHNPLDVVGGAGLGLFIGAVITLTLGPSMQKRTAGAASAPAATVTP